MELTLNTILWATLFVMVIIGVLIIRNSREQRKQKEDLEVLKNVLEKANDKLKLADSRKSEFLSFATHQLRSPLTSIKWGLGSLKEKYSQKTADHLFETTDDLIGTVNDLLDISKIEQGGMVIKKEEFDIHDFIRQIVEEFRITAEKKGLNMTFHGENEPCLVMADENKIRQVFVNLIDNAIKYTEKGNIDITLTKTDKDVCVGVKDTGAGINAVELSQLFSKFLRGQAGKSSQGGSGLGLYLAKKIIEEHHGDISVRSKGLGEGSTFTVRLPLNG